jgi:diaminopimelate decarboxylase
MLTRPEPKSSVLARAASEFGTPLYVYDLDAVLDRAERLRRLFGGRFGISYAVKANPNRALLSRLAAVVDGFDVSSIGEARSALKAGGAAARITFSGPAKRPDELETAVSIGVGELVLEQVHEAEALSRIAVAAGRTQDVLVRLNPTRMPRGFGVNMAGKPSQFGIDEEDMGPALDAIAPLPGLRLVGFHIFSGTNCLDAGAIAENFEIFTDIFARASEHADISPRKLVFGSGFGIPYTPDAVELDVERLAAIANPRIDAFKALARFSNAACVLEMGRWLVGPAGWLLTSVVSSKSSRGTEFRACDAGFNNHLAVCGMMGTIIRRNWRFENITNPDGKPGAFTLVGPLCTTIDILASAVELPEPRIGDVIAIPQSGAYGLTASPTRFISHPEPREVIASSGTLSEVTESRLNHP